MREQLQEYLSGKRRDFDLALDLRGTDFQKRCWNELLRIPYGETRSYGEIARAVGSPRSCRAVGQANHYNPVAIVVPCRRRARVGLLPRRIRRRSCGQSLVVAAGRRSISGTARMHSQPAKQLAFAAG